MSNPICAVPLPSELQRELPAGTMVYSFDGEVVYRSKNPNLNQEPRTFTLLPIADNPAMYERRWTGYPMQETYLSIENFHGHTVTMFFFLFPEEKKTIAALSEKFMPLVKSAVKNLPAATQELYAAAENMIPVKEQASDAGPTYRTGAFAAMSWSTHQWLVVNSTIAAGLIFEPPIDVGKLLVKSMLSRNFIAKRLDRNDLNTTRIDALVLYLKRMMSQQMQQNDADNGRL